MMHGEYNVNHCLELWGIFSFEQKEEVRVYNLDMLLLLDVCKYKTKDIGFEVMGQRRQGKSSQGST